MRWDYIDIGIDRKEAEARILKFGFKECSHGWEIPLKRSFGSGARLHIVPSAYHMEVHQDRDVNGVHKVVRSERSIRVVKRIIERLNHHSKIKLFFRKLWSLV